MIMVIVEYSFKYRRAWWLSQNRTRVHWCTALVHGKAISICMQWRL